MATSWTEEQRAAISSRGQNLLLSAAAGSGKTAVLVGRIIARLTDAEKPVSADKLLVVTFTNAAAAEMRERILSAITALAEEQPENAFLAQQVSLVKKAQITTIDAFCIDLLRQNFVAANLSPDFRIADPTENNVLRDEVLDTVLTELYDDAEFSEDFFKLLESYANAKANDKTFRELVHALFQFVMSIPNPVAWLNEAANRFAQAESFEQSLWFDLIFKEAKDELLKSILEYDTMILLAQEDGFSAYEMLLKEEREQFVKVMEQNTYDGMRDALSGIVFKTRPRVPKDMLPKYAETIHAMRDKVKKGRVAKLKEKMFAITKEQQTKAIALAYPAMRCLSEIVIRLKERFFAQKLEKNMLDFNDCEHLCLSILVDENGNLTETALATREKFDEIYIDEYQDTSRLQEAIFSAIKRENNLFMVGDIKQSIYRFRNTDPSLFKGKQDSFSKLEDAQERKIILSKNFRSRENVLSSVNYIFERIMSPDSGEIDYNEDEMLYPGANFPDNAVSPISSDTELCIIDTSSVQESAEDDLEDMEKTELAALFTANRIAELIEGGEQIYDGGEYRPMRYSDICIISRNVKDVAPILSAVLSQQGIPCFSENTGGFLDSAEITTILSMLSVIDNPLQDLPLLSVLRSVMFGFSAETLARIRCMDKRVSFYEAMKLYAESDMPEQDSVKDALFVISDLIEKAKYMHVSTLIQTIYHTTAFYDAQQTMRNGVVRRANLRLFYHRAKEFEKTGMKGLYSFLQYIHDYHGAGGDFDAAKVVGAEQDAVRIMSIHKSKGLEFPVVILFGIEKQFNMLDLRKSVLYHAELGYGPKFVDTGLRITYPFAPRIALERVLRAECVAEEMRILYVAMTRAKEKLIFVGAVRGLDKKINALANGGSARKIPPAIVSECNSYLDWILLALLNHPDCKALRSLCDTERKIVMDESRFSVNFICDANQLLLEEAEQNIPAAEHNANLLDQILPLLSFQYPREQDTILPSKITVTELKRRTQSIESDDGIYLFPPERVLHMSPTRLTGAQIGTAYHTVMQRLELSGGLSTKEEVSNQIHAICQKGFLTEEEAGAINPEKIVKFFSSNAGKMMLTAKWVKREVMFGILEQANMLLPSFQTDTPIMLQGVIDCVLETDKGLCIIDYKTDKTYRAEDTVEKYKVQLDCYQLAAERIFQKKVTSKILYLFDTDMGISL